MRRSARAGKDEGERHRLDRLVRSVRDHYRHFMNPANWRRGEAKGGQVYEIEIGGFCAALLERRDGRWLWGVREAGASHSVIYLDQVVTTAGLDEANARHGAWKALMTQIEASA